MLSTPPPAKVYDDTEIYEQFTCGYTMLAGLPWREIEELELTEVAAALSRWLDKVG